MDTPGFVWIVGQYHHKPPATISPTPTHPHFFLTPLNTSKPGGLTGGEIGEEDRERSWDGDVIELGVGASTWEGDLSSCVEWGRGDEGGSPKEGGPEGSDSCEDIDGLQKVNGSKTFLNFIA